MSSADDSIGGQLMDKSNDSKSDNKENIDYLSLNFSPILFVDDNGLGLHFSMKPCLERKTIRQIIEIGGGFMSSNKYSNELINLVTLNTKLSDKQKSDHKFYYLTLIYDSVKDNTLRDFNEYLIIKTTTIEKSSDSEVIRELQENDQNLSQNKSDVEQLSSDSYEMDLRILELIGKRKAFADIIGSRIWLKCLENGIQIGDNWKSTKQHFFDQIMPNIDKYLIEELNKNKFIEYYNKYKDRETHNKSNTEQQKQSSEVSDDKQTDEEVDEQVVSDSEESNQMDSQPKDKTIESNDETTEKESQKSTNDSESDFDDESEESTSKYFKSNERFIYRKKPNPEKSGYYNAYLDFMKQRENSNTPENLKRIKEALKGSVVDNKKDSKSECLVKNSKTIKNSSFGAKIVAKETESQEIGHKVSDISSDESDRKSKSDDKPNKSGFKKPKSIAGTNKMVSQKHNTMYTLSEDESILEFVIKSKRLDELKGNILWKIAQKDDICQGRSWQSMKERFKKHIMPNIDLSQYDITIKQKERLKTYFYSEDMNTTRRQTENSYTHEEDMDIIKEVIRNSGEELVKGNRLWKKIGNDFKKKGSSRSWQSLKERYLKRIIPNLNNYDIKLEIAKKLLASISSIEDNKKQIIYNKCKKASIKPKKRPLDVRQTQTKDSVEETDNQKTINPKKKKTDEESNEQNDSQVSSRTRKRTKRL